MSESKSIAEGQYTCWWSSDDKFGYSKKTVFLFFWIAASNHGLSAPKSRLERNVWQEYEGILICIINTNLSIF